MSGAAKDPAELARAARVRAAIARGATITQHGGGVVAMSVPGEQGMLVTSGDELRKIIPGWPRPDEGQVLKRGRT
jgi:hypothetical protein